MARPEMPWKALNFRLSDRPVAITPSGLMTRVAPVVRCRSEVSRDAIVALNTVLSLPNGSNNKLTTA